MEGAANRTQPSIGGTAAVVGGIAFVVGYVAPIILYPSSNLGPLLGILVTGPIGWLAGALVGIVRSARSQQPSPVRHELLWLGAIWALSLLYALWSVFMWSTTIFIGLLEIALLAAVVATAAYLFYGKNARPLPHSIRPFRLPVIVAGLLTVATMIFPPIQTTAAGQQRFARLGDPRFDASQHVPEFSVDSGALALEWLTIAIAAFALGYALKGLSKPTQP